MSVFEVDRSGILSWQKCPRDRYYSRHYMGRGIEKLTKSLPLQFGAAFHEGAEQLLKGEGIEAAVRQTLLYLDLAFSVAKVDMGDEGKPTEAMVAYGINEQKAIAEGLLRAWWIEKGQQFVDDFEVLEVEQEGRADLARDLTLMFRPDALVREKLTGDYYLVSWKTASTFGQYTINQINSDMQSMSEVWGRLNEVERKGSSSKAGANVRVSDVGSSNSMLDLGEGTERTRLRSVDQQTKEISERACAQEYVGNGERASLFGIGTGSSVQESRLHTSRSSGSDNSCRELSKGEALQVPTGDGGSNSEGPCGGDGLSKVGQEVSDELCTSSRDRTRIAAIEGNLYLFCVKGQRRMDDYLGFKTQDSPLAYGWVRRNGPDEEWAFRYKWASEEEGKKFTQLPKGFRKVTIWDNYPGGVKAWVEALAAREITPRHINPFEAIFPNSLPVARRADEIESWRRQIVSQESRIRQRVLAVETAHGDEEVLDREFPQHTSHCYNFNSPCSFMPICFTPSVKADPLASGLYQIRVSNHPERGGEE